MKPVSPFYRNHPNLYFDKSPVFSYSYFEFDKRCKNASQGVLLTTVEQISRDWYYFLAREFDTEVAPFHAFFYPSTKVKPLATTMCWRFSTEKISEISIFYQLSYLRLYPHQMFFETIPHEVCHAISHLIFGYRKMVNLQHGKEWQELMEFVGLEPSENCTLITYDEALAAKELVEIIGNDCTIPQIDFSSKMWKD